MTKITKIIMGALISVVMLGGVISYASPGDHFGKFGGMGEKKIGFIINRISEKLDLNDVQKQNLVALKDTFKAQRDIQKQKQNPREALVQLLSEPVLDETKVLTMMEERMTQFHLSAPTVVSAIANFTNSLNDEQRAEIVSMADNFRKHRGGRHGKHFRGGFFGEAE